jgi:hypothetical protein
VSGRGDSAGELVTRCAGAGIGGATVGILVLFDWRGLWVTLGVALAAAVFGALVAVSTVAPEPSPSARRTPQRLPRRPLVDVRAGTAPRSRPVPPGEPAGSPEPARIVLPVEAPQAAEWWNGTPVDRAAPPPTTGAPARTAPPRPSVADLAAYRRPVRTVQCPRCGAFRTDVQQAGDPGGGYAFRCRVDDHTWTWRPGTAWPVTVVASRRRPER